jgi:hypothetical protein
MPTFITQRVHNSRSFPRVIVVDGQLDSLVAGFIGRWIHWSLDSLVVVSGFDSRTRRDRRATRLRP